MTVSLPQPGEVICYSYLWADEFEAGQEEGAKNCPCAVVMNLASPAGDVRLIVLPITHRAPANPAHAVEIPAGTKRPSRFGQRAFLDRFE